MSSQIVLSLDDLAPGKATTVHVTNEAGTSVPVALVRESAGDVYAIGDTCTHGEVSLGEGDVEGDEVECWAHGGRFSIKTGEATELPAMEPVPVYSVSIVDGNIVVDVDAPVPALKEN
ncbi:MULTISPECIES: non-heme iron oxygenase ferredoxin subunit [Demequina]|uniref:non-heme iron oxygenase ferredoxin subunit n=1 Tax=Demequina TaxID=577469 RepID=UPI000780B6CF|nr:MULTISPECIES: non-heme iron oxygenase ferredoxin subunit [Demequina]